MSQIVGCGTSTHLVCFVQIYTQSHGGPVPCLSWYINIHKQNWYRYIPVTGAPPSHILRLSHLLLLRSSTLPVLPPSAEEPTTPIRLETTRATPAHACRKRWGTRGDQYRPTLARSCRSTSGTLRPRRGAGPAKQVIGALREKKAGR